ncbi:MAG TPA: class I SAM-dependent methyltransferase [Vicinamibacterales bacterium]|jgi:SAM-dependent methyltransferase|nr:class I SAM-dependent methyltransferase [Vicinamibacterales bacterium]
MRVYYKRVTPQHFGNFEANLRFIDATGVFARPGIRALEVGTGTGALLHELIRRGYSVRGVELNPSLIDEGRARFGALPVEQVSGVGLPAADGEFDVVLSFDVFEHIQDTGAHLAEVSRVLAPGGSYLLQTPQKWWNTLFETIRWRSATAWRRDHCALHTMSELKACLRRHGLEPVAWDVPVVNEFFREKVRRHLGLPGTAVLAVVNPDRLPLAWRTNMYVQAVKQG